MSNRGVYPPIGDAGPGGPLEGCDAYSATVYANPDSVYEDMFVLLDSAGFDPRREEGFKARFYAQNRLLVDSQGLQLLAVKSGGRNPHPHIECTGRAARVVGAYLREHYRHGPTRIDHAIDLADGDFRKLVRQTRRLAKEFRVKWEPKGDWVTEDAGRTIQLGSRSSQVFVRVYEKGLKYAHDLGLPVTDELRRWVRVEIEFKPDTPIAKSIAPTVEPSALWGTALWSAELAKRVASMVTEPICIRERRESNRDRALRFALAQYGKHLNALCEDLGGDWAEVGRWIGERLDDGSEGVQDAA